MWRAAMPFLSRDAIDDGTANALVGTASAAPARLGAKDKLSRNRGALWLGVLLISMTALRLCVCSELPLSPDEAYYWVWSRALAPGYLDHPPMVALFIRLGTWFAGDTVFGIRLLGPFAAALGSVMIWDASRLIVGRDDVGVTAAVLVNAMPLFAIGASVMTPDTPLMFFWTATLWALARLAVSGDALWWPVVGLFAGLALASKYSAASIGIAVTLWIVIAARRQSRRPAAYAAAIVAATEFAPVIYWNAVHGWIGYAKQGARLVAWQPDRAFQYLAELIGAQFGLATPGIFILCIAGVIVAWRRIRMPDGGRWALLACISTVPALAMVQHAIGDRVQANWPAIIYPSAAIAAASLSTASWHRARAFAIALGFVVTGLVYGITLFVPPLLPAARDPIARQLAGWNGLAIQIDLARRAAGAEFVAVEGYGVASELARELPPDAVVVGVSPRWSSFALPHIRLGDHAGLLVTRQQEAPAGVASSVVKRVAGSEIVETYNVTELRGSALGELTLLPRPSIPIRDHAQ